MHFRNNPIVYICIMIQESKLSSNSKTPSIQNSTTVRKYRRQGQGGGLVTLIHKSVNFSRKPESPETLVEPHLEVLTITATLGDTELIITNPTHPHQAPARKVNFLPWTTAPLCPAAKVMGALILTTINTHLLPAFDHHGFRP